MNKINFLDCTLRDGGYYNSWDFEYKAVNEYLKAVKQAGVHIAEIGFRSLKNDEGVKGASAFTTDDYIHTLNIPSGLSLAVMINASELLLGYKIDNKSFNKLIPKRRKGSSLDTIRIACHFDEFKAVWYRKVLSTNDQYIHRVFNVFDDNGIIIYIHNIYIYIYITIYSLSI